MKIDTLYKEELATLYSYSEMLKETVYKLNEEEGQKVSELARKVCALVEREVYTTLVSNMTYFTEAHQKWLENK